MRDLMPNRLHLFWPAFERGSLSPSWWLSGGIDPVHCIAAYQAKAAASYAASKINLANPGTHDLTNGGMDVNWTTAVGWGVFDDLAKVFRITVTVGENWSALCRFSELTAPNSSSMLFGAYGVVGGRMHCSPHRVQDTSGRYSNGGLSEMSPAVITGVCGVAGRQAVVNSIAQGSLASYSAAPDFLFGVGGASASPTYIGYRCNCYVQAFGLWDTVLTGAQITAVCNAMAGL